MMGLKDWVAFGGHTKCSQCRVNDATGQVRMADNRWVKVCSSCKRAMGVTKAENAKAHRDKPAKQPRVNEYGGRPYRTKDSRPKTQHVDSERMDK